MKLKTIDLLLDCYIKERIPDSVGILVESPNDVSVPKERSHTFSFSPTPPPRDSITDTSELKERSHSFSFAPTPPIYFGVAQGLTTDGPSSTTVQGESLCSSCDPYFLPSADVTDGLSHEERQRCVAVAKKLAKIADEFQENYKSCFHEENLKTFSNENEKGYTPEEWNTLKRIYSEGASQGISRIALVLGNCFTPQTLQAVLRFLSGQNDDVSQQMAIALELSTHMIKQMGGRMFSTIRSVVTETFRNRAELEDL